MGYSEWRSWRSSYFLPRVFHFANSMSVFYGVFLTSSWKLSWGLVLWHLGAFIVEIPQLGNGMYFSYGGLVQNWKIPLEKNGGSLARSSTN